MDRKLLKKLIKASCKDGHLNEEIAKKIASKLRRKDLKTYIKGLENILKQNTVFIDTPIESAKENSQTLQEMFKNKEVIFRTDPSIILGVRITDNDLIYEMSLKHTLEHLVKHVTNDYD